MGRHHEFISGHTLVTHSIWAKSSIAKHYFASAITFDVAAEKKSWRNYLASKDSISYYVSYPPLSFILPYAYMQAMDLPITPESLRSYAIANHFFTSYLLFVLIYIVFRKQITREYFIPAYIAFSVFIYSSGGLWFHSNVYFTDIQVNFFVLLLLIWISYCSWYESTLNHPLYLASLSLIVFLGIYTEWLMVFMSFAAGLFFLFKAFKNKRYYYPTAAILAGAGAAIVLIIVQYSQIDGWDNLLFVWKDKLIQRSGTSTLYENQTWSNPSSYQQLSSNLSNNFLYVLRLALLSAVLLLIERFKYKNLLRYGQVFMVLTLLAAGILLHIVCFFNFNVLHDFGMVKVSLLLSILASLGYCAVQRLALPYLPKHLLWIGLFIVWTLLQIVNGVNQYKRKYSSKSINYYHINIGKKIRQWARSDEVVFANYATPESIYYGQRYIHNVKNATAALEWLQKSNYDKGIYLEALTDTSSHLSGMYRIHKNGQINSVHE